MCEPGSCKAGKISGLVLVGAFCLVGFLKSGLAFFEWSFLLVFFFFGTERLSVVLSFLLGRMGISECRDCSLSASAGAPSHQRHHPAF